MNIIRFALRKPIAIMVILMAVVPQHSGLFFSKSRQRTYQPKRFRQQSICCQFLFHPLSKHLSDDAT